MTVLERINELCDSHNITVYKLEKEVGIAPSTIRKWDKSSPTCKGLALVADYFDVSMDYLMGRSSSPVSHKNSFSKLSIRIIKDLEKYDIPDLQIEALCKIINSILKDFK